MTEVRIVKTLAGGLGALLLATQATPAAAQDLSSTIDGHVNAAVENVNNAVADATRNANAEWNKFVRMANESLPPGSSLPHNPAPVPAPKVPGARGWAPQAKAPVAPGRNGEIVGAGRSYLVWVPANYNPARPTPVMVGYSAYQDSTENFRNYSRLRESAVGQNAIIVYPRAIGASWEGSPTAVTRPGQDIRFVRAMIDDVQRYYNIDRRRIYATGMSTGGGMAAVSACHMADLFAGVAGVSGAYYAPVNRGCQPIPVAFMAVHGTGDTLTPYHGTVRRGERVLPVAAMFASYERRNRCAGGVDRASVGPNATRVSARGCAKGVQVIQVHGSNHYWWYSPSAADELWWFLSRHAK
ncbi:PHB depolymerase family esterase [uncultured Corynebacterium sp.]|uniref:alpha/beta hydrolase family esterase n=1 Tax=uncultured Corynebacterium sp. TaxID=159447 RepID=UPI0026266AC3|nr:PHB depolymerase family esterase [uncultured Corynebacterium sp.]